MDFDSTVLQEAFIIFSKCLAEVEKDHWTPSALFRNEKGYKRGMHGVTPPTSYSLWGMILTFWEPLALYSHGEATLELIIALLGSEASKMQETSPKQLELNQGKEGVETLLLHCANMAQAIFQEQQNRYFDTEEGRGINVRY